MENFILSVQRFDEFAEEYASRFDNVSGYVDRLTYFCNHCHISRPASQFQNGGFIGFYLVTEMLKLIDIARRHLPDVDFRVMDVRDISTIPDRFDAVMCSFCLPFLSKSDATQLIVDCAAHLVSGGVLYVSTMEGDETRAGFETTSFSGNSEIYFNYHLQRDLEDAFAKKNGFEIRQVKLQEYIEPDGSVTTDMIFIGVKR